MSSISFRSSFISNQKTQIPSLSKTPSKSSISQYNTFKSFKRFTYQALNQKETQTQNDKNLNASNEDNSDDCNISSEEKENESILNNEHPFIKMKQYSQEIIVKKNINLDNNTLQFDQLISKYYFKNNRNKEKSNERVICELKEILVEISHKQKNIEKLKQEINELQEKLNVINKNKNVISVTNGSNKMNNLISERNNNANGINLFNHAKTTCTSNSNFPNKLQMQNRYIQFKELVSKIKTQIIEQKKKEVNNQFIKEMMP